MRRGSGHTIVTPCCAWRDSLYHRPMMSAVRLTLAMVFAALIVSLSAAQGLMRGPDVFGQSTIVICNGHGTELLTLDHTGTPVEAAPTCPDTSLVAALMARAQAGLAPMRLSPVEPLRLNPLDLPGLLAPKPLTRAPPVAI